MQLMFDLGFNRGVVTAFMLQCFPNMKVIGVEAHPGFIHTFNTNYKCSNLTLLHNVVAEHSDQDIEFTICDNNPGISSINQEWMKTIRHSHFFDQSKHTIFVRSITIDTLIERYGTPDFIKMDIEGSEYTALLGLSQKVGLICFEWSEEWWHHTEKCVQRLLELGYTEFASDTRWENIAYNKPEIDLNLQYYPWSEFDKSNIVPNRKLKWGMMYAR